MQQRDISDRVHNHVFDRGNAAGERGTRAVAWLVTGDPTLTADKVRKWLSIHEEIVHSTIEVNRG